MKKQSLSLLKQACAAIAITAIAILASAQGEAPPPPPSQLCKVALSAVENDIRNLAQRMVQVAALTDLNHKARALAQLNLDLTALERAHGAGILKQVAALVTELQKTQDSDQSQEQAGQLASRQEESNTLEKWTRIAKAPKYYELKGKSSVHFAPASKKILRFQKDKLEILDIDRLTEPAQEIRLPEDDDARKASLSPDESTLLVTARTDSGTNHYLVQLPELKVVPLEMGLRQSFLKFGFMADGAVLRYGNSKFEVLSRSGARIGKESQSIRLSFQSIRSSIEPRYTFLMEGAELSGVFDRNTMSTLNLNKASHVRPVYNPLLDVVYSVETLTYRKTSPINRVSLKGDPQSTALQIFKPRPWSTLMPSGDQKTLIAVERESHPRKLDLSYDVLHFVDMATETLIPTALPKFHFHALIKPQPFGPLVFVHGQLASAKEYRSYLVDTHTGQVRELEVLEDLMPEWVEFSHDGNSIIYTLRGKPETFELK